MKKAILIIVALVIVVIGGAIWFTISNLDSIVKEVIETAGTKTVGTKVGVGSVSISLKDGKATIKQFTVANPAGFSSAPAISFGELTIDIDYKTGAVQRIYTGTPAFVFEQKGAQSNFGQLQKNIQTATKSEPAAKEEPKETGSPEDTIIQIDDFTIENASLKVISDQLQEPKEMTLKRLSVSNLKGTPAQVAKQAMGQIVAKIMAEAARQTVTGAIEGKAGDALEKGREEVGGLLKKLGQ